MTIEPLIRRSIAVAVASVLLLGSAHAGAPMVKTQAPGFYRMMLGDFEVTALFDGILELHAKQLLTDATEARIGELLARSFEKDAVPTSVNAYLVNTGPKLVLIDAGTANLFGPTLGHLIENLKASGYLPEQVDEVYITHLHGDHVGGLMAGDKLAFPNATVRADRQDSDYWLSQADMDKAPQEKQGTFKAAMAALNPYVAAGKYKPFDGDTELVPGVKAVAAHGHTPGHSIYAVESKGQKLVFWGDLMHVAAVQFPQPSITIKFDSDSKAAAAQRKSAFAQAAKEGYLIAAAHLSFPGIGHLRAEGEGYAFLPVAYTPVK